MGARDDRAAEGRRRQRVVRNVSRRERGRARLADAGRGGAARTGFQAAGMGAVQRGHGLQMRNAIYGYIAESDKQTKATYMREIVMPGMAQLLHRPAYDFTRPYEYNRSRGAFGCYHCHRVK